MPGLDGGAPVAECAGCHGKGGAGSRARSGAMRNRTVRCIDGVLPLDPAPLPAA